MPSARLTAVRSEHYNARQANQISPKSTQILRKNHIFVTPQRRVHQLGLLTAAVVALVAFAILKSTYMGILFGFLAWKNYEAMQSVRWR